MAQTDYAFLKATAQAQTKCPIPAPGWHPVYWHPVYWHPVHSHTADPTAEDYLHAMHDYSRDVIERVIAIGCDYVQLDASNYGMFHCDAEACAFFAS
jgi:hypothetical protein